MDGIWIGLLVLLALGVLVFGFVILAGDYYLTQFSFESENNEDVRTITMTDTQLDLARTSVVMRWITLGLAILSGAVYAAGMSM